MSGERGGSVVERRTPDRAVRGSNLPPRCCVLEQDTLLPEVLVGSRTITMHVFILPAITAAEKRTST